MSRRPADSFREGFATPYAFMLIIFLSILFIGLSYLIASSKRSVTQLPDTETERLIRDITEDIIESLLSDDTPGSDSPTDPVWDTVGSLNTEELSIELNDSSSRFNPNFFRDELTDKTGIGKLIFKDSHTMAEIEQLRHDLGLISNPQILSEEYFSDEGLENFITIHSYMNINIADELALTGLFEARTGRDFEAESFRRKIQTARINDTVIPNNEIESILGTSISELYPFICAIPVMNIHFIPEELLKEILSYDFGDNPLPYPDRTYNTIIQQRTGSEIDTSELESIFSVKDEPHIIFDYLGTKTWFWKITIRTNNQRHEIIIAEIPDIKHSYRPGGSSSESNSGQRTIQIISNIRYEEELE